MEMIRHQRESEHLNGVGVGSYGSHLIFTGKIGLVSVTLFTKRIRPVHACHLAIKGFESQFVPHLLK